MAEKNDYDSTAMIRAQRQSIVFNNEFENIHTDHIEHFAEMRRQTMILNKNMLVKHKTIKEESEEKSS